MANWDELKQTFFEETKEGLEAIDAGLIRKDRNIVMVAFGVGLTWAGVAMRWGVDV